MPKQNKPHKWRRIKFLVGATASLFIARNTPVRAVTFNFSYDVKTSFGNTQAIVDNFEQASDLWSSYLEDDLILNIRVDYNDLPGSVIGGATSAMTRVNYDKYLSALAADSTSEADRQALFSLPMIEEDQVQIEQYLAGERALKDVKLKSKAFPLLRDSSLDPNDDLRQSYRDDDGNDNNKKIWLTRANAKALGLIKEDDKKLDAVIEMDDETNWDFDRSDGIDSGKFDFQTVAQHEIGHALGFISGVDAFELVAVSKGPNPKDKDLAYVSPMDLYRYSEESAEQNSIDLRIGQEIEKYYSVDGGQTIVTDGNGNPAYFSTGSIDVGGDGYQASHWREGGDRLGIMNPELRAGQTGDIGNLDLSLLDTLGWDRENALAQKAATVGIDWNSLEQEFEQDKQTLIETLIAEWKAENPNDEYATEANIAELLNAEAARRGEEFYIEIEKKLDKIVEEAAKDPEKVDKKKEDFLDKDWNKQREKFDKELAKVTKDWESIDSRILGWLELEADKLAKELEEANGGEIRVLSKILNEGTAEQQVIWEAKLLSALALLTDKPSKALEELRKSSSDRNPVGWGRWGSYWFQTGIEDDDGIDLTVYNTTSATSQTVPEPNSIIGLLGFGLASLWCWKKRHRSR